MMSKGFENIVGNIGLPLAAWEPFFGISPM